MSIWVEHDLTVKIVDALTDLSDDGPDHHFGSPWLTAYQLAIELQHQYPETVQAISERNASALAIASSSPTRTGSAR